MKRDHISAGAPMGLPTSPRANTPLRATAYPSDPGLLHLDREVDLRGLGRGLRRTRWVILAALFAVVALTAIVVWLQTPEYESETTIHLADPTSAESGLLGSIPGLGSLSGFASSLPTELALLQSRTLAETVVDSLGLRVRLLKPESLSRDAVLEVIAAPRDSMAGIYELRRRDDGTYAVSALGSASAPNPAVTRTGEPLQLAGVTVRLRARADAPERMRIAVLPFRVAVGALQENLTIQQLTAGAQVLDIRARDTDPVLAAAITNTLAAEYVAYKSRTETSSAANSVGFLQEQVDRYVAQLAEAEARLQRFQESERIVSLSEQAAAAVRQAANVQAERDMLRTERAALLEVLAGAEREPHNDTGASPYRRLATFPTFLSNGIVQNLVRSLTELETHRSQLLGRFQPEHPDVRQVNGRIAEIETQLHQLASNYEQSLASEIGAMNATLDQYSSQLAEAPARQIEYARLVRTNEMLQQVYELLETQLKEAQIRAAGEPVDVRVLDAAVVPKEPVSPRPVLAMALAVAVGLMVGIGIALVRVLLDPKVRTPQDAVRAAGGAPVLGAIPRLWIANTDNGTGRRRLVARGSRGRVDGNVSHGQLVTFEHAASPAAEAYRGLRARLALLDGGDAPRVIVTTSAMPGEGKSVTAANLAIALAQQGIRTLLVDADLRQGSLHRLLGVERTPGLTELLRGASETEAAVRELASGAQPLPLAVLPCGAAATNPAELLGSARMRQFLEGARTRYEVIVMDAPPLHAAADAVVLGALGDSVLLVARAGTTHKRALADAAAELQRLGIPLEGLVINDLDEYEAPYTRYAASAPE